MEKVPYYRVALLASTEMIPALLLQGNGVARLEFDTQLFRDTCGYYAAFIVI